MSTASRVSTLYEGPVLPQTLKIGLPVLAGNLLFSLYTVVDTYFVALIDRSSTDLVSGITLVLPVALVFQALAMGLNLGITTRVSNDLGASNPQAANAAFNTGLAMAVVVTVIALAGLYPFLDVVIDTLAGKTAAAPIKDIGRSFLATLIPGLCLQVLGAVFFGTLRGVGHTVPVFFMFLLATVLNVVLDPLLIFTFSLGVSGAGLATSVSFAVSAAAVCLYLAFRPALQLSFHFRLVTWGLLADLARLGGAQTLNMLSASLGVFLLNGLVGSLGTQELTSWGLCLRVDPFFLIPLFGVTAANITLVGHNRGRGNHRRVLQVFRVHLRSMLVLAVLLTATYILAAPWLFAAFSTVPEVVAASVLQVSIVSLSTFGLALEVLVTNTFQGLGKTLPVALLVTVRLLVLTVGPSYLLVTVFHTGMPGVFATMAVAQVFTGLIAYVWLRRELQNPPILPADSQRLVSH